ncbi:uncharacterized protein LOC141604564 [Silene latifolia]|uniref:uncharacterized protein LOC141604564 n=1 Tax=Silene latifolia TaxID=37657 RepID=UPI003D77FCAF
MNNRWEIQQNAMVGRCEEMRGPVVVSGRNGQIVCPKPRRVGFLGGNIAMSLRWQQISHQSEINDAKTGAELLDLIFMGKEGHGEDQSPGEIATSPPFFCGTPPSRASNPLVQDSQFGDDSLSPLSTLQTAYPSPSPSPSISPSPMKSGCVRMKFGLKSPTIRVEGFDFDCLSRDCQSSSVTAMA